MTTLFNLAFAIYLLALLTSAIALFAWRKPLSWVSIGSLSAGVLLQTVYIGMRWVEAGRAPFSNMFESLVLFAWAVAVVYLVIRARINIPALGTASCLLVLLVLAYASAFESNIKPLMPALQSNWLSVHVFTCFLGYAKQKCMFRGHSRNDILIDGIMSLQNGAHFHDMSRRILRRITGKFSKGPFIFSHMWKDLTFQYNLCIGRKFKINRLPLYYLKGHSQKTARNIVLVTPDRSFPEPAAKVKEWMSTDNYGYFECLPLFFSNSLVLPEMTTTVQADTQSLRSFYL